MKKILLTTLFLLFLSVLSPTNSYAECYQGGDTDRYNACVLSGGNVTCGQHEAGYEVCCNEGSTCPAGTPGYQGPISAGCYNSTEVNYNACTFSPQAVNCGQAQNGFSVCCTSNLTCPPGTTGAPPPAVGGKDVLCSDQNSINTALGCLPINDISQWGGIILRIGIGLGGGIAFLMILYAGFVITTSTGDPKRLQAGQELLGAAIGGILMLIFSVFILRILGVNILGVLQ